MAAGVLPWPMVVSPSLVLRAWPAGESGVVAALLTERLGPVRVLARGARRPRSRLSPLVQPGRWIEAEHTWREGRDLQYLRGGEVVRDLLAGASLEQTAYLLAALELVERSQRGEDGDPAVYALCRRWLPVLSSSATAAAVFYRFELLLLAAHGTAPRLDRCLEGGRELADEGTVVLAVAQGGCLCRRCAGRGGGREIAGGLRDVLARLADPQAPPPELNADRRRAAGVLLHHLLARHLPGYRLPAALALLRAPAGPRAPERPEEG